MFKVNNKGTRMTSIVNFKHVNTDWDHVLTVSMNRMSAN